MVFDILYVSILLLEKYYFFFFFPFYHLCHPQGYPAALFVIDERVCDKAKAPNHLTTPEQPVVGGPSFTLQCKIKGEKTCTLYKVTGLEYIKMP